MVVLSPRLMAPIYHVPHVDKQAIAPCVVAQANAFATIMIILAICQVPQLLLTPAVKFYTIAMTTARFHRLQIDDMENAPNVTGASMKALLTSMLRHRHREQERPITTAMAQLARSATGRVTTIIIHAPSACS